MPTFFNKDELTPAQKARWDYAIGEYQRVLGANAKHRFENISDANRAAYFEQGIKTDSEILAAIEQSNLTMATPPGHPKSALFARLLNGQEALPMPPPKAYSYPWYSVIEQAGWHRAQLGDFIEHDDHPSPRAVMINQSEWKVISLNPAAMRLVELDAALSKTAKPNPEYEFEKLFDWGNGLLEQVKEAYAAGPEFIVKCDQWPAYRLFVGQQDTEANCQTGVKHHATELVSPQTLQDSRVNSVFDLVMLSINVRIGKTIRQGVHPQTQLDQAKKEYLQYVERKQERSLMGTHLEKEIEQSSEALAAKVAIFEAAPDREDWVQMFMDLWHLEKVAV